MHGLTGFFVTAGLFGFMIEGIPVPVLYQTPPFSIAWTSLALPSGALASCASITGLRLEWETNAVIGGATVAISSLLWIFALLRGNRGPGPLAASPRLP